MVERFLGDRAGAQGPSALVRMPTGTGKSGVIAIAAQELVSSGDVLLLTPWDVLVRQLAADVETHFWQQINAAAPVGKDVVRIFPSTGEAELSARLGPTIWMATIATLQALRAAAGGAYQQLRRRVRLVVVDEGHYEPARSWSEAVRGLGRPTVLFSATPYRNDVKYFDLAEDFQFHFSHSEAEASRILRKVAFKPIAFGGIPEFCDGVVAAVDERFGNDASTKIIIRCDSRAEIGQIIDALQNRGQSVLGVHEGFPAQEGTRLQRVPDPDSRTERYWVHQFKLTEGIDSADFKAVAFYRPLPTERAFVQQVGRVLRNPSRSRTDIGLVIHRLGDSLDASWEAYRSYDRAAKDGLPKSPLEIAAQQPPPQYIDGKFRDTFDIRNEVRARDLLFPRSVRVLQVDEGFDLDNFTLSVEAHLEDNDCQFHRVVTPHADARLHPYLVIFNSPLLARSAFFQCRFGFAYYRRIGNYLFYLDTEGQHPEALATLMPAETSSLRRLYKGASVRLGSISLSNTDMGQFSARRRTIHARSIGDLAPDLSDHAQLATTVTGTFESTDSTGMRKYVSRYVGFSRSRVSDRGMVEFDDFNEWLAELALALDDKTIKALQVFDRYADVIARPRNVTPRNILLDFDPSEFFDSRASAPNGVLRIDDLCRDVTNGLFTLVANDEPYEVAIAWDETTGRYLLRCHDLDDRFSIPTTSTGPQAVTLVSHLNREQAFRVIPAVGKGTGYCIYTSRRFYKPRLPLGPSSSDNPDLLRLFEGVQELGSLSSEKGPDNSATGPGWAAGSLFAFIDSCGAGSSLAADMQFDLLVCDDMGTEIADFLGLDRTGKRVVAIHAKAFNPAKKLSASALQEVSAQAVKNLAYLQPYPYGTPRNLDQWDQAWKSRHGTVAKRLRRGNGTPAYLWSQFREALTDPQTAREVWIMMGQGPSQTLLQQESRQAQPKAEAIQMLFSLQATWGAVSAVGARLRVLSSV